MSSSAIVNMKLAAHSEMRNPVSACAVIPTGKRSSRSTTTFPIRSTNSLALSGAKRWSGC